MEIEQKAQEYAKKKAESFLNDAFAEAYKQGFADGVASVKSNKEPIVVDGVEYVDLGLPSGTLWANDYMMDEKSNVCFIPFGEAQKYPIPSMDQMYEFVENTKLMLDGYSFRFLGPNGNSVKFRGYSVNGRQSYPLTWIISEVKNNNGLCFCTENGSTVGSTKCKTKELFTGYAIPLLLVKNKYN